MALASCWSLRRSLDASREPLCPLLAEASFFSSNLISDLTAGPLTNCLSRQFCTAAIITNTHTTTCPERRGLSPFLSSKTADLCFLIIFLLKFQKTIRITRFGSLITSKHALIGPSCVQTSFDKARSSLVTAAVVRLGVHAWTRWFSCARPSFSLPKP